MTVALPAPPAPADLPALRAHAAAVAVEAGVLARRYHDERSDLVVEKKGLQDYVSEADRAVERMIVDALAERTPGVPVLGEEGGVAGHPDRSAAELADGPLWVVDPIDGTGNFLRGIPFFCVSIALVAGRESVLGVVHDPMRGETFEAHRGGGAWLGGERVRTSGTDAFDHAVIAMGSSPKAPREAYLAAHDRLFDEKVKIRRLGAAALAGAYVACGRLDAFFEHSLNSWDVLAAAVLVREAGGWASDFVRGGEGLGERGSWLVSNAPFATELRAIAGIDAP